MEEEPLAIGAGAGDSAIIKKALDISEQILCENSIREWDEKTPSFDQFRQTISEIETALMDKIQVYKNKGLEVDFDLLLGSLSPDGIVSLYIFDRRGVAQPVHDDPGFACIGSGFYLGGNLLLQQFYSQNLNLVDAIHLTAYVINQVSMVDAGVGPFEGESWYFRLEKGKPFLGGLSAKSRIFKEIKSEYRWRQKLLKYVWQQCELISSKKCNKIIRRAIKKWKKEENQEST